MQFRCGVNTSPASRHGLPATRSRISPARRTPADLEFTVIAVVVLKESYHVTAPPGASDVYSRSVNAALWLLNHFLRRNGGRSNIVGEPRGRKEDARIQQAYQAAYIGGIHDIPSSEVQRLLPPVISWREKSERTRASNSPICRRTRSRDEHTNGPTHIRLTSTYFRSCTTAASQKTELLVTESYRSRHSIFDFCRKAGRHPHEPVSWDGAGGQVPPADNHSTT